MSYRPSCCDREREKKILDDCTGKTVEDRRKLWMKVITGLTENFSGTRSGRADLNEGADVAVGELSEWEKYRI
jgi:hypothetical protein